MNKMSVIKLMSKMYYCHRQYDLTYEAAQKGSLHLIYFI